jgi:D-serine deaminase-like pyridoxal phosphate-dependent protein
MTQEWYDIKNVAEIDSPAFVVYVDRVKENIRIIKKMIDDVDRLRPHIKTHKTKEICLLLLEAGITKFKCATIAEAELLGIVNAPDVLFAYQPVGPKLLRVISLIKAYPSTNFSCLIDNAVSAKNISDAAQKENLTIPLFVDLNVGMNRTGINLGPGVVTLYQNISSLKGIELKGFHVYDGHIKSPDLNKRKEESDAVFRKIEQIKKELMAVGFEEPVIVAGGTPTFPIHAQRENIECSPGTFVYWDAGYVKNFPEQIFLPAGLVITRIISLPDKTKICLDMGHKAIAAENELAHRVVFLNAPGIKPVSQSEEHLVAEAQEGHSYKIGDVLYALPVHICPTAALYEKALIVENGTIVTEWRTAARDRKIII